MFVWINKAECKYRSRMGVVTVRKGSKLQANTTANRRKILNIPHGLYSPVAR